jgi:hypothetical protein
VGGLTGGVGDSDPPVARGGEGLRTKERRGAEPMKEAELRALTDRVLTDSL